MLFFKKTPDIISPKSSQIGHPNRRHENTFFYHKLILQYKIKGFVAQCRSFGLLKKSNLSYIALIYTDKKENKIFLIYKEIQKEAIAKSYMINGLLIYD
jgi:hypothetical protein